MTAGRPDAVTLNSVTAATKTRTQAQQHRPGLRGLATAYRVHGRHQLAVGDPSQPDVQDEGARGAP